MAQYSQLTDVALMLRVRQGEESAFEELHTRYQRKALTYFHGLTRDPQIVGELCQETFLRLWKVRKRYRASGSFPGYLFGIARMIWHERRRELAKSWRLGIRQPLEEHLEPAVRRGLHPDNRAAAAEIAAHIHEALEELPAEQREVFVLRAICGMAVEDIAAAMDCPVNTVRSRKILAVKKLRHLLSEVFIATSGVGTGERNHELQPNTTTVHGLPGR